MDIVLNTTFNNPNLPIIEVPGFSDDFNRPAANTLGTTPGGKEWQYFGTTPWKITANNTATGLGATPHAAVDARTAEGTLEVTVAKQATETADNRGGLLFRQVDSENYYYVCPNTDGILTLYGKIANATTISQSMAGTKLTTGDKLKVTMLGASVTVYVNDAEIKTHTLPDLTTGTHHGLFTNGSCDTEWDNISFTV